MTRSEKRERKRKRCLFIRPIFGLTVDGIEQVKCYNCGDFKPYNKEEMKNGYCR